VTPDGGRTWQIENFPSYGSFPQMTKLAGGGRHLIAGASLSGVTLETVGIFLGTVDTDHPAVEADRLVEPDPPNLDLATPSTTEADATEESPNVATGDDVLNMTVPAGACQGISGSAVELSNGDGQADGVSVWIAADVPGQVASGDLDGDGAEESVVIVNCSAGGNSIFQSVFVVPAGAAPVDIWSAVNDNASDLIGQGYVDFVTGIELDGGAMVIDWVGALPGDPSCCPSVRASSRFEWNGGTIRFVSHTPVGG
jgi:hypothetical protein